MKFVIFNYIIVIIYFLIILIFLWFTRNEKRGFKYTAFIIAFVHVFVIFYSKLSSNSPSISQQISYFNESKNVDVANIKDITYCISNKTCYSSHNTELIKETIFFLKNSENVYFENKLMKERGVLTLNTQNRTYRYIIWEDVNKKILATLYLAKYKIGSFKNTHILYVLDKIIKENTIKK